MLTTLLLGVLIPPWGMARMANIPTGGIEVKEGRWATWTGRTWWWSAAEQPGTPP
ncbi:Uncharacterised protein [Mycobacteroides abscessus]|nr:Uncharacterised protein [Mycobacteroides abscessus]